MSKEIISATNIPTQETLKTPSLPPLYNLMEEGVVEDLVAQGRTPLITEGSVYKIHRFGETEVRKVSICYVPPIGVRQKDYPVLREAGAIEFLSPRGKSRGYATPYFLTEIEEMLIKERISLAQPKPIRTNRQAA